MNSIQSYRWRSRRFSAAPPSASFSRGRRPARRTRRPLSDAIQEIIVTAQRRIAEHAGRADLDAGDDRPKTLQQLNVSTFDDYIKYLPNVTTANNGPGQNEVFMRGLSAGSQPSQGSARRACGRTSPSTWTTNPAQLPNRNLDIYAADLNRIEVLEGPQGTLFGAGAEAGVIRYITNEPKLDVTEASVKAGYGVTAHGDPNTDVTAVLNLPLIADTMAVRAVIYDDQRGGYIDNVPATFTRKNTDIGIHYAHYPAGRRTAARTACRNAGYCVPPGSPVINNSNVAGNAINPVTYQGIRVEVLYKFNDDWDVLLTQSYQDMNSQGVFYQQPNASDGAPLQAARGHAVQHAFDKDKFESTAWTVNGKFGDLKAVYTGGYLVRNVEQVGDYTNYARGVYADYYQCYGPGSGYDTSLKSTCFSPSATWHSAEHNTHQQHEFRLSTPDDWRLRAHRRRVLGGQQAVRPDRLELQDRAFVHLERCAGHAGQYRLLRGHRHVPRHDRRESRGSGRTPPPSIRTRCARPSRRRSSPRSTSTSFRRC